MIEISLPIRLQTPNIKEHWTKTYKRNKRMKVAVGYLLRTNSELSRIAQDMGVSTSGWFKDKNAAKGFKIKVTFVKFGRTFDFDNMVYAFKTVRDTVCGFFFPDLAAGQADCQECFDIHYLQQKGGSGIKIILEIVTL